MIHRKAASALGALALAGGIVLALAAPAAAHHNVPDISHVKGDCGEVTLTAAWTEDTHTVGNAVLVVDDDTEAKTAGIGEPVTVGPFGAGWHTIHYRVFGGGERGSDSPQWTETDKDKLNKFAADNGGWAFTAAGVEMTAPFVTWHSLKVKGCATESEVSFIPDCDGTTVTVASGTFYGEYEWSAVWADGAESASLTVDAGTSAELAQVPADAGEISVDFAGSPTGWPKTYTYTKADVEKDCAVASPSPTPSVSPSPSAPGGGGEASDDELALTGASWVPAGVAVGGAGVVSGVVLLIAFRRKTSAFAAE